MITNIDPVEPTVLPPVISEPVRPTEPQVPQD